MNTNIKITLTDQQRDHIKNLIDGNTSAKLATRAEITDLVDMFIENLIDSNLSSAKKITDQTVSNVSGYKFYEKDIEIKAEEFIKFSCDDCGCMVSVEENKLKNLPKDETGLGHFWQDTLPQNFNWGS